MEHGIIVAIKWLFIRVVGIYPTIFKWRFIRLVFLSDRLIIHKVLWHLIEEGQFTIMKTLFRNDYSMYDDSSYDAN